MKKRSYRRIPIKQFSIQSVTGAVPKGRLVFSVDVAKTDMVAGFADDRGHVVAFLGWRHPQDNAILLALLQSLQAEGYTIEAVMESSGTYGDVLRQQLHELGVSIFKVSGKRTHDAREIYDGVPSLHDAKCAATVDFELSREDGSAVEAKGEDGRWRLGESSGYGIPPTIYGALSSVDDRVARWRGETQVIRPYCSGPVEWLACAGGGERPCVRCEKVRAMIVSPGSLYGHSVSHGRRPVTCHDPCPKYPESPSVRRLRALSARVSLWHAQKEPLAAVPSLYKLRADCLREHPQVDRARTR